MENIVLVGRLGAGKTSFAKLLHERTGYAVYEVGDVVREECERNRQGKTPLEYAIDMFGKFGGEYFVAKLFREVTGKDSNIIVGIRSLAELRYLRSRLNDIVIIAIKADREIRKQRYDICKKLKPDNSDFDERERVENGWGVEDVMKQASIVVENNTMDYGDLVNSAEEVLKIILEKGK